MLETNSPFEGSVYLVSLPFTCYKRWLVLPGTLPVLLLTGCNTSQMPNYLDPRGPAATEIADLWWVMFGLGTTVFVIVFTLFLFAIYRGRRDRYDKDPRPPSGKKLVIIGGVVFPLPILLIVLGHTILTGTRTAGTPFLVGAEATDELTIDVTGHMFWWEVRYPGQEIVTANEIHIPAGEPVRFRVTAGDVIHSFWIPQLHGKIDMLPGKVNTIYLEADEPGVYRGLCAEFCGIQHAHMQFLVVAQPRNRFDQWIEQQRTPPPEPEDELVQRGRQLFLGSPCSYCHAIDGVNPESATQFEAPNLTNIGSRHTLGAGIIENNRGNLGGWILNPQEVKPGNAMPPTRLNSEDLHALLAYLQSLK